MTLAHEDIHELINAYEAAEAEYLAEPCTFARWSGDHLIAAEVRPFPATLTAAWESVIDALGDAVGTSGLTAMSTELVFFTSRRSTPLSLHVNAIDPGDDRWSSLDRYGPVVEGSILGRSAAKVSPRRFFFGVGVIYNDTFGSYAAPALIARTALRQISA